MGIIKKAMNKKTRQHVLNSRILFLNDKLLRAYTKIFCLFRGKFHFFKKNLNNVNLQKVNEIKKNGVTFFKNYLSEDEVNKIVAMLEGLPVYNGYFSDFGKQKLDEVDRNKYHLAQYQRYDLLKISAVLDIANDPDILAIAQEFLGCKPMITNISAWWSFARRDRAVEAQKFHRDKDGLKFIKFFVYLTDVDNNCGPHVYIKKSSKSKFFRHANQQRISDEDVYKVFDKEKFETIITGVKGDAFMEDTFGVHKGLVPKDKDRLVLQIEYGIQTIPWEDYSEKIPYVKSYNFFVNKLLMSK